MSAQDPRYIIYSSQIQIHAQRSNPVYIERAYFSERGPQFVHKLQSQCTTFTFFSSSLFSSLKKDGSLSFSLSSRVPQMLPLFLLYCAVTMEKKNTIQHNNARKTGKKFGRVLKRYVLSLFSFKCSAYSICTAAFNSLFRRK